MNHDNISTLPLVEEENISFVRLPNPHTLEKYHEFTDLYHSFSDKDGNFSEMPHPLVEIFSC